MVHFGGSFGIIVMAPIVQLVITYWDWRAAWVVLAGVMLCVGVIPCALIVRRQPEDLGLAIDGTSGQAAATNSDDLRRDELQLSLAEVVRTPAFWFVLVSLFLTSSATSGIGLHLVPHLTQQGLTPAAAVGAISIMSIAGALSALMLGASAERAPPKLLMVLLYLVGAASMWVLSQADTLPETYLFAILQGIVGSGINTVAPIMWASYYGRRTLGSIFGMSRAAQVVGFAVGPLASAVVFDRTGTYQGAFFSLALVAIAAALVLLMARRPALPNQAQQTQQ
jgi:sugar phosphate permease